MKKKVAYTFLDFIKILGYFNLKDLKKKHTNQIPKYRGSGQMLNYSNASCVPKYNHRLQIVLFGPTIGQVF